jgi:hypothetical protein
MPFGISIMPEGVFFRLWAPGAVAVDSLWKIATAPGTFIPWLVMMAGIIS